MPSSSLLLLLLQLLLSMAAGAAVQCDWYRGSWVEDPSNPLYDWNSCPFIFKEFDCLRYGRRDTDYLRYRWQPTDGCSLPRFDGLELMKRLQGKKIMFVGDSITFNQYESFLCLLHAAAPNATFKVTKDQVLYTVTVKEYKLAVQYFASHYLVAIFHHDKYGRIMNLERISNSSKQIWATADVLLFNTWHWWHGRGNQQEWDYLLLRDHVHKDMDRTEAFKHAFFTWAFWAQSLPLATKIFFQGVSPTHKRGEEWGENASSTCMGQTKPSTPSEFVGAPLRQEEWVVKPALRLVRAKKKMFGERWKPIYLLDTSYLSQLRKDAHPSKYNGVNYDRDCSHWCLPGLPDTWNQILYAALIQDDPPLGY